MIEILVVLAVIGLLSAIGAASYLQWLPRQRLQSTAREAEILMQRARFAAIKKNRDVRISVAAGGIPEIAWTVLAHEIPRDLALPAVELVRLEIPTQHAIDIVGPPGDLDGVTFAGNELLFTGGTGVVNAVGDPGAIRFNDGRIPIPNVLEARVMNLGGQTEVLKFLDGADAPGGMPGFFPQTRASEGGRAIWKWY